jgi:hypothetical protein
VRGEASRWAAPLTSSRAKANRTTVGARAEGSRSGNYYAQYAKRRVRRWGIITIADLSTLCWAVMILLVIFIDQQITIDGVCIGGLIAACSVGLYLLFW